MARTFRLVTLAALGTAVLAGCARQSPPPSPRPAPAPAVSRGQALSAADYVATASSIDLFVLEASRLALGRATSGAIRDFASTLLADHGGTAAQLSFAGRRLNLLPSATLQARHQAMIDELNSASDFDSAWKRQMIAAHEQGVRVHGDFARDGASPTLRPVAEIAYPAMRRHLERLRGL